ncbi:amino acid ABC transporter ATP-binding protein [Agromyces italicus]|uniref:amino acid ABC transporter ATP-binding protein n=1 Tax=Agromyces italicus TaxID=279572 RepID=UPI0003B2FA7F|nr:amino acid ABC transporter ATP-binding protein [Agromyces italicus]
MSETTNPNAPLLQLVNVSKHFGELRAVDNVSLDIFAGTVTCIVGPSGSGKSTLLRTVNMMETIDGGAIFLKGQMIGHEVRHGHRVPVSNTVARRQTLNFGMVFQHFNLFPNYTAIENVAIGPTLLRKASKKAATAAGLRYLEQVGLADRADHYPSELSGGQQQRVAIARALAMEPQILLFDEPTSALDPELVSEVLSVMRGLAANGSTMLVVTHEMRFAEDVADEVIMMDAGKVIERGIPASLLHNPTTERAKKFFASVGTL